MPERIQEVDLGVVEQGHRPGQLAEEVACFPEVLGKATKISKAGSGMCTGGTQISLEEETLPSSPQEPEGQ
jgi:hypothetical protein